MYFIWAANNTDNAYTVHQALFFVVPMRHNKKEKKKEKEVLCLTTKKLYGHT